MKHPLKHPTKHRGAIIGLICAMSLPLAMPFSADARPPADGADCARTPPPGADGGPPPPPVAGPDAPRPPFLRGVRLTDEQRTQIREILDAQRDAMRDRMEALHAAHRDLRDLARAPDFDGARAKEIADQGAKAMSELEVLRAETDHKILALLTPEQRRRADERGPEGRDPRGDRPAPPPER